MRRKSRHSYRKKSRVRYTQLVPWLEQFFFLLFPLPPSGPTLYTPLWYEEKKNLHSFLEEKNLKMPHFKREEEFLVITNCQRAFTS